MNPGEFWALVTVIGMTIITVLTRALFFLSERDWRLPAWALGGLKYAPIAALAAVVVPEIVMPEGYLVSTWKSARLFAGIGAMAWYYWQRSLLGTILAGMAVYLPLHLVLGW